MSDGNGALPEGWAEAPLGELATAVQYGSSAKSSAENVGVPVLRMGNLFQGTLRFDDLKYLPTDHEEFPKLLLTEGDLLFNRTNSAELVGKTSVYEGTPDPCSFASYLIRVQFDEVESRLVSAYLNSPNGRVWAASQVSQQVGQANINGTKLKALSLPLPPLPEQRRIVSKIESIQERSSRARRALSEVGPLLEQFRQSVLRAAFSGRLTADWREANPDVEPADSMVDRLPEPPKPPRARKASIAKIKGDCGLSVGLTDMPIPRTWSWTPLTRLGQLVTGHTPSRKHPEYWDGDIAWIGIKDARNNDGRVIADTLQHVTELGIENSASRMLPKGTVLMTRTANSIGYSVVLGRDMATSQDLVGWILPEKVNPKFVMYLILAEHDALYRFAKGSAHPTVYFPEILSFHVALPPIEEQNEIVKRVEEMLGMIEHQTEVVTESQSDLTQLDQSILAKAFRGELVPQDPRDEPASVLLERIRAARSADETKRNAKPRRKIKKEIEA